MLSTSPDPISRITAPSFVLDQDIERDLHVTAMTLHRWDHDPAMLELGWPPKVIIARKKCREAELYQTFKENLVRRALAKRGELTAA
jgi:hypothetical protein